LIKLSEYWNQHKAKLASQKLTVLLLLLLAIYTVIGTIYQVEFGLYAAQKKFFNSPFVLLWFIPLPSVQLILWALFINLVAALQTRIIWKKVSTGIYLIHMGLLMLLLSGFYTLYFSHESFIELREEETTSRSSDYYNWQLLLINEDTGEKDSWKLNHLHPRNHYKSKLGLEFDVDDYFENSRIFDTPFAGRILKNLPVTKDAEQNIPSLLISLEGESMVEEAPVPVPAATEGEEVAVETSNASEELVAPEPKFVRKLQTQKLQLHGDGLRTGTVMLDSHSYVFTLLRKKYNLPFALELVDVDRKLYPGTEIAKGYKSEVILHEHGGLKRKLRISMNKPLRYWQYTVYQASYGVDEDGGEFSVFAVVDNAGRMLPYFASLIMALGIFVHFISRFLGFMRARALMSILLTLFVGMGSISAVRAEEPVLVAAVTEASAAAPVAEAAPVAVVEPATPASAEPLPVVTEEAKPEPSAAEPLQAPVTTEKLIEKESAPVKPVIKPELKPEAKQEAELVPAAKVEEAAAIATETKKSPLHKFVSKLVASLKSNPKTKLESEALVTEPKLSSGSGPLQLAVKSKPPVKAVKPVAVKEKAKLIAKAPEAKPVAKALPQPKKALSTVKTEEPAAVNGKAATSNAELAATEPDRDKLVVPVLAQMSQSDPDGLVDLSNLGKINSARFARMSVVDQGRVKPVDTLGRALLLRFSGKVSAKVEGGTIGANEWFTRLIFWPESVDDVNIFLINHPEVLEAFGLESNAGRRYSFKELQAVADKLNELGVLSMQVDTKERSIVEQEIVRVFDNFHTYIQVRESLKPLMSNADFRIEAEGRNLSLYEMLQRTEEIESTLSTVSLSAVDQLNDEQKEKFSLGVALYSWMEGHKAYMELFEREQQFRPLWLCNSSSGSCDWYTVWQVLSTKELRDNSRLRSQLAALTKVQKAYEAADQKTFDSALSEYTLRQHNSLKRNKQETARTNLEILYNNLNPLLIAKIFYGLALMLVLATGIAYARKFAAMALSLVLSAFALHSFALVARMLILHRPPVSNLYETFVFVSWVTVLLGLALGSLRKRSKEAGSTEFPLGTLLSSFAGFLLLMISSKFAVEGDTMQVVIAVLNSNFWLSTHVICVTIGYAGVASAGILAHVHLIKEIYCAVTQRDRNYKVEDEIQLIMGVLAFGFCFSFIGTILGGIWADQSWGRFWGWDPKENGALLIVLWTAAIFHARLSGLIGARGTAIAASVGTAVVMISWFGINLLGVGLHSYGFTSGLAFGLISYLIVETVFLSAAAYFTRENN
jgi:ABC-type transport system involved in cytochrome c biogenesis permease subunit